MPDPLAQGVTAEDGCPVFIMGKNKESYQLSAISHQQVQQNGTERSANETAYD
jgi:hypothetical protein